MKKIILLIIVLVSSLSGFAPNHSLDYKKSLTTIYERALEEQKIQNKIDLLEASEFSVDNLVLYLKLKKVSYYEVVLKQAILESGWFTSGLFKYGNNLFGMKVPLVRDTLASGKLYGHATYTHWTESVKDYIMWREYWINQGKEISEGYLSFLDSVGYAEDSQYIQIIKRININKYT